jgi:hypothetical protein
MVDLRVFKGRLGVSQGYSVGHLHSFGHTTDGELFYWWVHYGPIDVTASSWIVPGTIEPHKEDEDD